MSSATAPGRAPVLIVVAMPEEAAPLLARLREPRELPVPMTGPVACRAGELEGTPVVVLTCGIGIAAAASALTWAVLACGPRAVLSAGSAGGLAADVEVGTLIVGESFAYSIADATAFGYEAGQVPGQPARFGADPELADLAEEAARAALGADHVRRGLAVAGDAFVTADNAEQIRARFPGALSADMESTALAQVAATLDVPFLSVRSVSDLCGPSAGQQFHLELDVVAERSARAVEALAPRL